MWVGVREKALHEVQSRRDDAVEGKGCGVVLLGEAGVGKSTLLDRIASEARSRGCNVYRVTGSPSAEHDPFSAVASLVNELDASSQLSPAELDVRDHPSTPDESPASATPESESASIASVGVGLLTQLSDLAVARPLLLLVDDAQWIDSSSLAAFTFVARRLLADAVFMLFASRPRETDSRPSGDGLPSGDGVVGGAPFDVRGLVTIELLPLSIDESAAHLVSQGFPVDVARRAAFASGGLPLALAELVRVGVSEVAALAPISLRLPSRLAERTRALSPVVLDVATYAALEPEYRVLEEIFGAATRALLGEGERAGVLTVDRDRVAFTHPLLRTAVLDLADLSTRRQMHRSIAAALDPFSDADRRAHHLGEGADELDDVAAVCLDEFAERARRRGAHVEASNAFRRASELTTDHRLRSKRLLESGRTRYFAGDARAGIVIAEEVLATATDPDVRAEAEVLLAYASMWERNPEVVMTRLVTTADAIAENEPGRAAWALIAASAMAFVTEDVARGVDVGRRAEQAAERSGDVVASLAASGMLGWNLFLVGAMDEAETRNAAMDPVVMMLVDQGTMEGVSFGQNLAMRLIMMERFAEAEALLLRLLPMARRLGVELSAAMVSVVMGVLRWRQGLWDQALFYCLAPLESDELPRLSNAWSHAIAAQFLAAMGQIEKTEAHVAVVLGTPAVAGSAMIRSWAGAALGHLRLSQGNAAEAREHFDAVDAAMSTAGLAQPAFFLWQGDYIDSLIATGDHARAHVVVDHLATSQSCRDLAWCRGVVARARGAMSGDLREASELFSVAIDAFGSVGFPFEVARTHLAVGQAQISAGVDGHAALAKAKRMFTVLGASLWATAAEADLMSNAVLWPDRSDVPSDSPVPTPWSEVLTMAEHRVALAAGSGRTNPEVAEELYLSVRTVEFHLGSVYRKLGLKNRASLVARLANLMRAS